VAAGEYVLLSVTDNGVGMDEATRRRLYEPFFTTKDQGKGTGLGLATSYGIVKQNNGFIFADSRPGAGTTFRILLPRMVGELEVAPADTVRAHVAAGKETVLLVEDELNVRELLREYLVGQGYEVLSAASGYDAVELCCTRDVPPTVLVTDIVMSGMNGRVLAEQLRVLYPDLRVLCMSGYTDDALVRRGVLPSGTEFLQKPFLLADLAKKIREMVDASIG
jgi:two-component system, cell cycle sensor histidine kinase and response regulator CckA